MKVIYIVSTGRSGSTLVDVILGNSPVGHSLGEIYAIYRPFKKNHLDASCRCQNTQCKYETIIKNSDEDSFHENLLKKTDIEYLVDSSKDLNYLIDCYNRNLEKNISQHFLVVYKSPINLCYSHFKRGKSIKSWMRYYNYYNEFIETNIPFTAVNYEELVEEPKLILTKICDIFDIPYSIRNIDFWKNTPHYYFGSKSIEKIYNSKNPKIIQGVLPSNFESKFEICKATDKYKQILNVLDTLKQYDINGRDKANEEIKRKVIKNFNYTKRQAKHNYRKLRNTILSK